MKARARLRLAVIYIGAAIVMLGTVGPFLWLVSSSFQYERQLLNIPPQWLPNPVVLDSYREIFEGAVLGEESGVPYQSRIFLRSFANSFFVAGSVAVIAVMAGAYAAYPLARLNFRGRSTLLFGILASRLIPALSLAIPIVLVAKQIGMSDKIVTLVFINLSFILPYVIWLLQSYFKTIPLELEDAGRIDGCSRLQVVHKIILPLSLPGLTSAAILAFLLTWGEFLFALLLSETPDSYTSTVVVSLFATDVDVSFVSIITAGVISVIPPIAFALIFQRFIISGLLSGSLKG
ncbi:MAG: carbohydrate ABC transporter permease [Chloroflexota bacterium]|nr:carbohydrate ABC transporter permease [Chloroflexota bacterium]